MKLLFYLITLFPKSFFEYLIDLYISIGIFKLTKTYKITKINLQIAFPDASLKEINFISKLSYRETLISGFETMIAWGNKDFRSNKSIFKIENNFLYKSLSDSGLIAVAIHNRSVDMLLKWINSQTTTVSLYKKIKLKLLNNFVIKQRESGKSKCYETNIAGVRRIYEALKNKQIVCFAADQVPQRGYGEYIKFFGKDAYTTTLVQSLASKTLLPVIYFYINSNKLNFLEVKIKHCNNDIYNNSKHELLVNKDIENIINQRPIDYSWEYKRFKKSKTVSSDPYKDI